MRIIFIAILGQFFMTGQNAFAFETHKCPRIINLNVQSFDLAELTQQDSSPEKLEILEEVQSSLRRLSRLEVRYTLQFAGGAKCYYEGHNQTGLYFRGHIQMENKAGEKVPVFITKSKNYAVKVDLKDFSRSGAEAVAPEASLHYFEKSCPERGCPLTYTYLGTGNLRHFK